MFEEIKAIVAETLEQIKLPLHRKPLFQRI